MKTNKLPWLLLVAVALVSTAVWTARRGEPGGGTARAREGGWLFPALQDPATLNAVSDMTFESSAGTVTVRRTPAGWILPGRHGYPADFDRVRSFLQTLAGLKIGEPLGRDPGVMERLGLANEAGAPGATNTTRITLGRTDGPPVAVWQAGKWRTGAAGGPDGRYVAVDGEAFLIADSLFSLPQTSLDWMDRTLLDVQSAEVREVRVADPDGTAFRIFRTDAQSDFTVEGLATNEVPHQANISSVTSLASYLSLEDVPDPASPKLEEFGLQSPAVYTLHTFQGQTFTLRVGRGAADTNAFFARLSVAFTPPAPTAGEPPADEVGRKAWEERRTAEAEAQTRLAAETEKLNARLSPWIFKVPSYKFEQLKPGRNTWVQTREEPPSPAAGDEPEPEEIAAP